MLYAKVITIGGIEINARGTKIVLSREALPDFGYGFVVLGSLEKNPILEKIQIRGKPQTMKGARNPLSFLRVLFGRFLRAPEFTNGDTIAPSSGLIDELRYEARKDLLFVEKR